MSEKKSLFVTKKLFAVVVLSFLLAMMLGISVFAAPAAPSGFRQTYAYTNSAKVEWNAVVGKNIRYHVQYSTDNRNFSDASTDTLNPNIHKSNLSTGSTYYFRVRAYEYTYGKPNDYSAWSPSFEAVTVPDRVKTESLNQSAAKTSSISLTWSPATGATRYQVYKVDGSAQISATTTTSPSVTIGNLKTGTRNSFKVYAERVSSSGYVARNDYSAYIYANTLPGTVTGIKVAYSYPHSNQVALAWNRAENAKGYQITVYTMKNKKTGKTLNVSGSSYNTIKMNQKSFYKVKVRAYIQLNNGKKVYGNWGSTYVANQQEVKVRNVSGGLTASWPKVTGATNYTVYASDKAKSGYKKVYSTKSSSYTLKKYKGKKLKKGKTYYFYVIANKKVKGKTYKSVGSWYYGMTYRY
ncbi:fibronectin type III domain-containing protein [uncultured Robinsoniella sp.]|uniref:fibronectin type III domain-containing protein n=1 Tax=uncultured Robinsoniella sp. TaxID=904190 RepID=UPI00374EC9B2